MAPTQINDYTLLPIALPTQRSLSLPQAATHTIYLRPHAPKIPSETSSRSLFLVNVPVDSTPAHLRAIFTSLVGAGRFEDVEFEAESKSSATSKELIVAKPIGGKKRKRGPEIEEGEDEPLPQVWDRQLRRSGSSAVVVLVDEKSVEATLKEIRKLHKSSRKVKWPTWGEGVSNVPSLGSARYLAHQRLQYPDERALQANIDAFMTGFNTREENRARDAKKARNVPDEDGFITVSRGGRTGPARREDAESKRVEMEEREKAKRDGMSDFYRFQGRERRKVEQGELVKKFEEDRRRVGEMRERRGRGGFRPES